MDLESSFVCTSSWGGRRHDGAAPSTALAITPRRPGVRGQRYGIGRAGSLSTWTKRRIERGPGAAGVCPPPPGGPPQPLCGGRRRRLLARRQARQPGRVGERRDVGRIDLVTV